MKTGFLCEMKNRVKSSLGNMHFGFSNEKHSRWFENPVTLPEETSFIRHFVDHPECEGKINLLRDTKIILTRKQELDAMHHSVLFCTPAGDIQHFRLKIDRYYLARISHDLSHGS